MLREVIKHDCVEQVTLVEIDEAVPRVSKKYLPGMAIGFQHPKVNVHIGDGFQYLKDNEATFDVIITDSSDPVGPAESLFQDGFFALMKKSLRPGGLICTQGMNDCKERERCIAIHGHFLLGNDLKFTCTTLNSSRGMMMMNSNHQTSYMSQIEKHTFVVNTPFSLPYTTYSQNLIPFFSLPIQPHQANVNGFISTSLSGSWATHANSSPLSSMHGHQSPRTLPDRLATFCVARKKARISRLLRAPFPLTSLTLASSTIPATCTGQPLSCQTLLDLHCINETFFHDFPIQSHFTLETLEFPQFHRRKD